MFLFGVSQTPFKNNAFIYRHNSRIFCGSRLNGVGESSRLKITTNINFQFFARPVTSQAAALGAGAATNPPRALTAGHSTLPSSRGERLCVCACERGRGTELGCRSRTTAISLERSAGQLLSACLLSRGLSRNSLATSDALVCVLLSRIGDCGAWINAGRRLKEAHKAYLPLCLPTYT